jgi:Na+-translocating ferredoxin:NAD+ oxidoreductase RNF subunit RnfB
MNFIFTAAFALGAIALIAAAILYACSTKFAVKEDPRIPQVLDLLPGANCGGCGYPGCSGMADALVKGADIGSIEGLMCPVGGAECMRKVAALLGMAVANSEPKVAVVRCGGTCAVRPKTVVYDGLRTCTAINSTGAGETACGFGCVGGGDCERACTFDAIKINTETDIPEVDADKCTSCGACVKACPRHIIELRNKGKIIKNNARRVWVACQNKDKGGVARKACGAACIGCGKCQKVCKFEAITIENNLSYIDFNKCKACGLCVRECPTNAIKCTFELPPVKQTPKTLTV